VSTPKSLDLPDDVRQLTIESSRGAFAALEAEPTTGVCERRPALLIPGFTGSKEDFIPVLQPLASAGRRVVAIDMRGQYQSPGAREASGYAPDELGADITAIAEAIASDGLGLHLVGHSLGGLVAREATLAQGGAQIISLTLLSSGPGRITGQRASMLRDLLQMMTAAGTTDATDTSGSAGSTGAGSTGASAKAADGRLRATVERIFQEHLAPQAAAEGAPEPVIAFLRERMMQSSPTGLMVMGRYLLSCPDRTAELASPGRPDVLVLYGENDDAWRPAVQEQMARRLGADRVCIPGAGHSPAVEAPETTASTLTGFWRTAEDSHRRGLERAGEVGGRWGAAGPRSGSAQSGRDAAAVAPGSEAKASA
jgi:pimeloyl-ACP methyl ester carboxylesterase